MNECLRKELIRIFNECIDKLKSDKCEIGEEQAMILLNSFNHEPMSFTMACDYLHLSQSKFKELMTKNILPKGRHRRGFKEKVWYKDEIKNKFKEYKELQDK